MKKRKLTVNTIAGSNLKVRRRQYITMIISIILAMSFGSSILFFASTLVSSLKQRNIDMYGKENMIICNLGKETISVLNDSELIGEYGLSYITGYACNDTSGTNNGVAIARLDDKGLDFASIKLLEGKYPEADGELLLEKSSLLRLGLEDAKIGDQITLNVYTPNGAEDYLQTPIEKSYTLCGIAENKFTNISNGYDIRKDNLQSGYVYSGAQAAPGGKEKLALYTKFDYGSRKNDYDNYSKLHDLLSKNGGDDSRIITLPDSFLSTLSSYDEGNSSMVQTVALAALLAAVLMVASCVGIVNAFGTNLNDRKQQIGMLRTVGATKRQIISIYGRESTILTLICVPASLAVSFFAVKGIISLLGKNFVFIPNFGVLAAGGVFSIICVLIAAFIPLSSATRISPVQSIRDVEKTRKVKTKHIKTKKSFNTASLLAQRDMLFNRKKQVGVSLFLAITVFISCMGFSWLKQTQFNYDPGYDYSLNISSYSIYSGSVNFPAYEKGISSSGIARLQSSPYIKEAYGCASCNAFLESDSMFSDYITTAYGRPLDIAFDNGSYDEIGAYADKIIADKANLNSVLTKAISDKCADAKQQFGLSSNSANINVAIMDYAGIEMLAKYAESGAPNEAAMDSGNEVMVIAPKEIGYAIEKIESTASEYTESTDFIKKQESERMHLLKTAERDFSVGDKLKLAFISSNEDPEKLTAEYPSDCKKTEKEFTIGTIINELPENCNIPIEKGMESSPIIIITTMAGIRNYLPNLPYKNAYAYLKEECTSEANKEITAMLNDIAAASGIENPSIYSNYDFVQETRSNYNATLTALLSVIILMLSISAGVINSHLSGEIREGKRAIGTMRAVGATHSLIAKSYILRFLSMFIWGCAAGFGAYLIVFLSMFAQAHGEIQSMLLGFEIWQTLSACVLLFIICSVNLASKIRKETKNSIIDNIREL